MDQLKRLLASLTIAQRITITLAVVLVVAGLTLTLRWNRERDFRPLYGNMAAEDAGAVLAKLRESAVEYRLSDNGTTILVPSARVAELRLQMATAGLPKTGRIGFELFDKTNFGTSDFAEQINYRRALEGELERSSMALTGLEQARVHITFPKDSVFTESRQPAKASVLIKLRPGARLTPQNVTAITYLVASAVEGLQADAVSVVDMQGNLLSRPHRPGMPDGSDPSDATLEFRQRVEKDLLAKVNATLEPLLGPEKFRAGVSVDCDFTSGEQSDETLDPTHSVMVQAQRTEEGAPAREASGVPGTASALPRPTSRPGTGSSGLSRRTENITYQSSRTVRRVRLPQGTVKRMSVSVLVDHTLRWEGGSKPRKVLEPPTAETLKVIHDLVAAATGLVPDRGDQLIVETLPFEATLHAEPVSLEAPPAVPPSGVPAWLERLFKENNVLVLAAIGTGTVVVLLGAILFFALRSKRRGNEAKPAGELPAGAGGAKQLVVAAGPDLAQQIESKLAEQAALKERQAAEMMSSLKLPQVTTKKAEVLTKHILEEAKKEPIATAQVLRSWLNESDQ